MNGMHFIHHPRADGSAARIVAVVLASCAFHGLAFCLLLGLTFFYPPSRPLPKSGSAASAPSIALETMVIVSPPVAPPPVPTPTPTPVVAAPPPPPVAVKPPEGTVPVLTAQLSKPVSAIPPSPTPTRSTPHPLSPKVTKVTAKSTPKPPAATAPSSYAPGVNVLPHPPYPPEATDRGETGVVLMNVQFDAKGNVAHAEVAQSSGVRLLDIETRAFIRTHWHSTTYAGQTISQAVEYSLKNSSN